MECQRMDWLLSWFPLGLQILPLLKGKKGARIPSANCGLFPCFLFSGQFSFLAYTVSPSEGGAQCSFQAGDIRLLSRQNLVRKSFELLLLKSRTCGFVFHISLKNVTKYLGKSVSDLFQSFLCHRDKTEQEGHSFKCI